ncbi:LAFA_0G20230g1_1 [Lachancea sp. 'fantastica']|nr:LAFA_0G20230g1_1 [Lachancea sp. 'fantastica']
MASAYAASAEDVVRRLRPFGMFFETSLKDLIKSIRGASEDPEQLQQVLGQALADCREEVRSPDVELKANAVVKLTYLEMYGFDMAWANFHILEVMSSSKLQHKRIGYLAASQTFYKDADVLMLATNLLKKDLRYEGRRDGRNDVLTMGVTLSGLSTMVTAPLARDICDDLFGMLSSSRPYIRKKAIAALFKVFLQFPEALRDHFDRFAARLRDEDQSVVSATVSVVCELSKKNPRPFVVLSPLLYEMLLTIDNNWIIIRLLKLFTNLAQVEPKLRAKILPKVLDLMEMTSATSVIYESINCIVRGHMLEEDDYDAAATCLQELIKFCNSNDPNLRYISVILFYKIGKINPEFIAKFDTLVIRLLKDVDVSIRSRALELLEGATDEDNLASVVQTLIQQFTDKDMVSTSNLFQQASKTCIEIEIPVSYKIKMVSVILKICSFDNYAKIPDFDWYIAVLSDLCVVSQDLNNSTIGNQLADEIRNVMVKVPDLRPKFIETIVNLVLNPDITQQMPMILREGYWCIGEYSSILRNGDEFIKKSVKQQRVQPQVLQIMSQALIKVFSNWCNNDAESKSVPRVKEVLGELVGFYECLSTSQWFEVQERAVEFLEFCRLCDESLKSDEEELPLLITEILPGFFNAYDLKPIMHGTQLKIQENLALDLETPFLSNEELENLLLQDSNRTDEGDSVLESDLELDSESDDDGDIIQPSEQSRTVPLQGIKKSDMTAEERHSLEEKRRQDRMDNPFYLDAGDELPETKDSKLIDFDGEETRTEPKSVGTLDLSIISSGSRSKNKSKGKKKAQVLVEEGLPDLLPDTQYNRGSLDKVLSSSSSVNSSAINLKTQSKLENFDFSSPHISPGVTPFGENDDSADIEKLRAKFASPSFGNSQNPDDEEVIVVKKKSKSKSKSKSKASKSKSKSKSKKSEKNSGEIPDSTEPMP